MNRKGTLAVRLPLAVAAAAAVAVLLGLSGLLVCSTYPTYEEVPIECTVDDGHTFDPIDDFSSDVYWFPSADYSPDAGPPADDAAPTATSTATSTSTDKSVASGGDNKYVASASVTITSIPDGPMCGISRAGVFRASHNNDWGGMFGMWKFSDTAIDPPERRDGSQFEGISFWARAPGNTTKGFTLLLDDDNTAGNAVGHNCRDYSVDGGATGQPSSTTVVNDPGTGTPITGSSNTRAPYPDECGNGFFVVVSLTSDWRFYTIPWSRFQQSFTPNRVPNAVLAGDPGALDAGTTLLTSRLRRLGIRMPKEAEMELWLAKLAFYRRTAQ
jgi:hypothetical protein